MKKILSALLILSASVISNVTLADSFVYKTDKMANNNNSFTFPGLDLNGAAATLYFSTDEFSPHATLTKLALDFEFAKDLLVTNFEMVEPGVYTARAAKAWVFKEILVEVRTDYNESFQNAEIRLAVPEFTSSVSNMEITPGVDLFISWTPLIDSSRVRVADTAVFTHLGKRVLLKLKDRISASGSEASPNSFGGSGFELEIDWLGHGVRTVFIEAPMPELEYRNYEAVGLMLESFEQNGEIDYTLAVNFSPKDAFHNEQSPVQPFLQILESAFNLAR